MEVDNGDEFTRVGIYLMLLNYILAKFATQKG